MGNKGMKMKRLTFCDRAKIEMLRRNGVQVAAIATELGVSRAAIYRELEKGKTDSGSYCAEKAEAARIIGIARQRGVSLDVLREAIK